MSIGGGLHKAVERIQKVNGQALQIFSKNQRQWHAPPLDDDSCLAFKQAWKAWGRYPVMIHGSYLINLAAKDQEIWEKSITALANELDRAYKLGIPWVVVHPGSHGGKGKKHGLQQVALAIDQALEQSTAKKVQIILETTAGQGTALGACFEDLAFILKNSNKNEILGVCIDTAHIFAAGYDLRTPEAFHQTFEQIDRTIGVDKLRLFHLNDSKAPLGTHRDRHEHIGQGEIGMKGFQLLLNDPRFAEFPMILETPKGKDLTEDIKNLTLLRSLFSSP